MKHDAPGVPLIGDTGLKRSESGHLDPSGFHRNRNRNSDGDTLHMHMLLLRVLHGASVSDPVVHAGLAAALADDHGGDDNHEGHGDAYADVDGRKEGGFIADPTKDKASSVLAKTQCRQS